jgi:hypothetical protein
VTFGAVLSRVGAVGQGSSRRDIVRALSGAGIVWGTARFPRSVAAKKRHHGKKRKRARPNQFGCLEVGDPCKNVTQCCSGICDGKKGKRSCRAHGTGVCDQQAEGICTAVNPKLTACDNSGECACFRTTAGSNFCANTFVETACADCRKDADCAALGFPAGSACLPFFQGNCVASCETGMACLPPCGVGGVSGAG